MDSNINKINNSYKNYDLRLINVINQNKTDINRSIDDEQEQSQNSKFGKSCSEKFDSAKINIEINTKENKSSPITNNLKNSDNSQVSNDNDYVLKDRDLNSTESYTDYRSNSELPNKQGVKPKVKKNYASDCVFNEDHVENELNIYDKAQNKIKNKQERKSNRKKINELEIPQMKSSNDIKLSKNEVKKNDYVANQDTIFSYRNKHQTIKYVL